VRTTRIGAAIDGVNLRHLGLPVADSNRSMAFYAQYFGFDPATATRYPDGTTIVRNADGFDLALHDVSEPPPHPGFLHFGFGVPDVGQVHALRERMQADGVSIVERDDEPDLVSFKCLDPDGWRIEVYWEKG
jgi:catechol 2,3-dioxygenase-like lactoylglutathione lyase family enzyme